jgi:hypothetical protein
MPYGTVLADLHNDSLGNKLAPSSSVFRNRIQNGAMVIDQRNAGASITANNGAFPVDRFRMDCTQTGKGTIQQTPSTTETGYATRVAAGFTNYVAFTSSSAYSVTSTDEFTFTQNIEGYNAFDLSWGTSSAKTVTLSFWVYSSLTGTFGGSFANSGNNRSYPFTYTITAANTWEQKTITVAGDTSGTWLTTNGIGIRIFFGLGVGSNYNGTANAWATGDYRSVSGAVSVVGTNNASFYITGVQLEVGTQATSFDFRAYGTELMLCQRYFETSMTVAPADNMAVVSVGVYALSSSAATPLLTIPFEVIKRATPTLTYYAPLTTSPSGKVREDATGTIRTVTGGGTSSWGSIIGITSGTSSVVYQLGYQASAEL